MTSIAGYNISAAPCCGKTYRTIRYRSMNFSARRYWTDGYTESGLMPNGYGLRKCLCGAFYLRAEMIDLDEVEESDLENTSYPESEDLPKAIAQARNAQVEQAARLEYWQDLNHVYRQSYRVHRDAEEAATEAAWRALKPNQRSFWRKLLKLPAPIYKPPKNRPFTYPDFVPTTAQTDNMRALLELLNAAELRPRYLHEIAELHRELGEFELALMALGEYKEIDIGPPSMLIMEMANQQVTAPMRFRI